MTPLLLALCWTLLAPAQAGRKHKKEALKDPWSVESLAAYEAEVTPLVEKAAGRSFHTPPKVALVSSEDFARIVEEESLLIMQQVMGDTPEELRREAAQRQASATHAALLGKYAPAVGTLYLSPDVIAASAAQLGMPDRVVDVARVILAHELGHALQDQVVGLTGLIKAVPDEEGLRAAAGSWEGVATWVEEKVAAELGLTDVYLGLIKLQGWGPRGLEEPGAFSVWAQYGQGRAFIAWHAEQGGTDHMWEVLAHPPAATSMLFRPETWAPTVPPAPLDYASVLRGIDQELTRGDWMVANSRLGEFDLREDAVAADNAAELDRILEHMIGGQRLEANRPDRRAEVRVLDFDGDTWPAAYLDLLKTQRISAAAVTARQLDVAVEVLWEPLPDVTGDVSTLRIERIPIGGGRHLEAHSAWVLRGQTAVVVRTERFRPGLRLERTVDEVFRRLEEARAVPEELTPEARTEPP